MQSERKRDRVKALIVGHGDGFVQCFGPPELDAKIILAPYVAGTRGEILAERYIEQQLRGEYRSLYWPGMVRATGLIQRLTPADIADMLDRIELAQGIDEIAKRLRGAA